MFMNHFCQTQRSGKAVVDRSRNQHARRILITKLAVMTLRASKHLSHQLADVFKGNPLLAICR